MERTHLGFNYQSSRLLPWQFYFRNFVAMILDDRESCKKFKKKCQIDAHWKPFSLKCSFCEINYRIIGKIESFERDRKFIGRFIGVDFENLMDSGKLLVCYIHIVDFMVYRQSHIKSSHIVSRFQPKSATFE